MGRRTSGLYPRHSARGGEVEQDVGLLGHLALHQPPLRADLRPPQLALVGDGEAADQHRDGHRDDHHATYGAQAAQYLAHCGLREVICGQDLH